MMFRFRLALLVTFALIPLAMACSASPSAALGRTQLPNAAARRATSPGTRIPFQGDQRFLLGANLPWVNWSCDFGCGGNGGVSDPGVQAQLAPVLAQARQAGIRTIRWWMFEDDPWQIKRDGAGTPVGINPAVYADIDAALTLANQYDIAYDFVLFSSPTAIPRGWVTNSGQRAALAQTLAPLFAHYSGNPHILAWEVFNEPEFDIWNGKIDGGSVKALVKNIVDAVHANSSTYVTVGSAMLDGLPMWVGLGLDFYEAHWYDYMDSGNYDAMLWSYDDVRARYNLDAPLVIGEFYLGPDSKPLDRLAHFYDTGYAGAWPWSLLPSHTNDGMTIDLTAVNAFNQQHGDISPQANFGVNIGAYVPYHDPKFDISGTSSPGTTTPGGTETATITVTSDSNVTALVDIEVYDPAGNKIAQQYWDNVQFSAGGGWRYTVNWTAGQQRGTYTVKAGVFTPGWGKLYTWNNDVADVQVQ